VFPIIVVSSAYAWSVRVGIERIRLKRGSIERLKRSGANGSPCGTPLRTEKGRLR